MSFLIHVPEYVLFEDESILLLNKPAGLMVEPDRNNHPNLLHQVKQYLKGKELPGQEVYAQHIHRLDRPVSGVILFAKQRSVLKNLSEQFAERKVKKKYRALTASRPDSDSGILENWLRKEKKKAVLLSEPLIGAERVSLSYSVESFSSTKYQWDIALHTGKFHQIRAQLSALGCPILGDAMYGSEKVYKPDAIALHAYRLEFTHPISGESMLVEAPTQWL